MAKRNYWLRLKKNFFQSRDVKVVMSQKDGINFIIFWQKLLLETIDAETPGLLKYKENIPYTADLLSTVTDTSISIVKSAMNLFEKLGMIEIKENGEIWIEEVIKLVGSEAESTKRVQNFRKNKKIKALHCNANVTKCNTDIDIEKDIEKDLDKEKSKNINMSEEKSSLDISVDNSLSQSNKNKEIKEISPYRALTDYFCKKYEDYYSVPYDFKGGKDGSLMARMYKVYGADILKLIIDEFFNSSDDFINNKAGREIGILSSLSNKLAQKLSGAKNPISELTGWDKHNFELLEKMKREEQQKKGGNTDLPRENAVSRSVSTFISNISHKME